MSETKVWISARNCKRKKSYHLRWIDPASLKWKSRRAGTDRKRAEREAALLEQELTNGTHRGIINISWEEFTETICGFLTGRHAEGVKSTLEEFGDTMGVLRPRNVKPAIIRGYIQHLESRGNDMDANNSKRRSNRPATINRKLRNLRLAFRSGIELEYVALCPVMKLHWRKEHRKDDDERRILEPDEEESLLGAAEELYGFPMTVFIAFALETWGRLGEVTSVVWDDICFDEPGVYFRNTKSHEDRYVPIENPDLMANLFKLKVQTLQVGGPFTQHSNRSNLHKKWERIIAKAEIDPITVHDLRRTGITRALLDNVPITVVKDLAGHQKIETTMKYYKGVKKRDLRDALKRRRAVS